MSEKNELLLNCSIFDTRKMREEDYSGYELIRATTDILIINQNSKALLHRLPITLTSDKTIELDDDVEITAKTINGPYEITGTTLAQEHTFLVVNGPLKIAPNTEEILKKYEQIIVNGPVEYPEDLDGYLTKATFNGPSSVYPAGCILLDDDFTVDKYFPLRAKEGGKYYAKNTIVIKDKAVDLAKLVQKNVQFVTKHLVLPECMVETGAPLFDERTDFIVVPDGLEIVYGNSELNEELILKNGNRLFIYGDLEADENTDMEKLSGMIEKLVVHGTVSLLKSQKEAFLKIDAEYDELEIARKGMSNLLTAKLDKTLFDNSPDGISVCNVANVVIAEDVTPEMILEKLSLTNCARVLCNESQESAVAAVGVNINKIGSKKDDDSQENSNNNSQKNARILSNKKMINADYYIG